MGHVSCEPLALEPGIEAVFLEARVMRPVAPIGLCLDQMADPGRSPSIQVAAKVPIERRDRAHRVRDQVHVMDMEDRFREALLPRRGEPEVLSLQEIHQHRASEVK